MKRRAPHQGRRHPLAWPLLAVVLLHVVGVGLLLLSALPGELRLASGEVFGLGLGLAAYTLGMRHAFDADHIATIDTTTRKLLHEGERPHASGFFFSAGHSTVVLVLVLLVAVGVRGLGDAVTDEHSTLHSLTAVWGPTVAGTFLLVIGAVNVAVVRQSIAVARAVRRGGVAVTTAHATPRGRGPISALTRRLAARVSRPWQLYPVGLAFGLGFDTATEITLLVLAGGTAASGLPLGAILSLPLLFAAGMTLLDTINGAATTRAYSWALTAPARRIAYNVAVTGISVACALIIGTLSLVGVAVNELSITHGPLAALAAADAAVLGYALVLLILGAWAAASLWARAMERRTTASHGAA